MTQSKNDAAPAGFLAPSGGLFIPPPRTASDNGATRPLPVFVQDSPRTFYGSIRETK